MEQQEFLDWIGTFTDGEAYIASLKAQKPSFRINTLKIPTPIFDEVTQINCSKVDWYSEARVCQAPIQLGTTLEYFLGYLYPQSLSSMVPPLVLDPKEGEYVLDLAAAPGSKTTQLSQLMKNTGTIAANDLPEREITMVPNLSRLGVLNTIVMNRDAEEFPLKREFDKVLIDAPCTAIGAKLNAINRFELTKSQSMSHTQKRLLQKAFDALIEGGTLVYSTCTVSPHECEEVVLSLLYRRPEAIVEDIALDMPHEHGLSEFGSEITKCWRIYPQQIGSEGFFIAKIRKGAR